MSDLTASQAAAIAKEAAEQAITQFVNTPAFTVAVSERTYAALEMVGIDTKNPDKTRADFVNLREWNEFWRFLRNKGAGAVITWLVTGGLAALTVGLYYKFK